ncbi:poly(beta-D-mannuronate) C5 epimerase [Azotobacter chroococcum]|jgi:poly(beta-D-mannuronate) C5 epimerase|uniref:mannuronan 5-epimerase n=2 Tax=Azotobacter chroococcum TaxID=353 RepID=A0A4R1PM18_9GAMM|nr:right-handed parallel beta-helix repeat-containing protein [Azotobacter chroococcum]TCL32298.1 poly(beta-D-mannuronate) C5 epimerase [Azotobacter chroococcum]
MNMQRRLASTQLKPLLLGVLLATSAWSQAAPPQAAGQSAPATLSSKQYSVTSASIEALHLDAPKLPDLSGYTPAAVEAKIQRKPGGHLAVRRMLQQNALKDFTGGNERLREWVSRQGGMPHAIFVEGGYVELSQLARQLPPSQFAETAPGVYVARLPIVVAPGATLHIGKNVKELRLSEERGSFLVNDGKLFITDTKVVGWSEKNNAPSSYRGEEVFRPFLVSWGGTETYISRSTIASLGYNTSKSYGVSITQYTPEMHKRLKRSHPTGWLIDSVFEDIYYGFYCYEAEDVVVKGNTYRDNIVYGIDPHDRSERLIIAENHVYGTKKKHGIIVSREVNNSWIINNRTHDNKLSGIVLDRNSEHNLVAYNEVYQNHSDGITLYESSNNLIWGNRIIGNARHGIRMRNSMNIRIYENLAAANQLTGIYGHIKDLSNTDRNFKLDPFDTKVSMIVVGGQLAGNGSSPISVDSPLSLELYRVEMLAPTKSSGLTFTGVLEDKQEEILDLLIRRQKAVLIDPAVDPTQAEL